MRMDLERRTFCQWTIWSLALLAIPEITATELPHDHRAVVIVRREVASTSIASVGYAAFSRVLEIEFRSGAVYRFFDVPPATFEGLMKAPSKGRYFTKHLRDRYPFLRVEARQP